jgi:hypothetical protein
LRRGSVFNRRTKRMNLRKSLEARVGIESSSQTESLLEKSDTAI